MAALTVTRLGRRDYAEMVQVQERLAAEKAERERLAAEKAEQERLAAEKAKAEEEKRAAAEVQTAEVTRSVPAQPVMPPAPKPAAAVPSAGTDANTADILAQKRELMTQVRLLTDLHQQGLISDEEYKQRKKAILDSVFTLARRQDAGSPNRSVGVAPPAPSWGEMLNQGKAYINEGLWHLVWMPGIAIFVTVTMFNLVGEGLRDALDPKLRQ